MNADEFHFEKASNNTPGSTQTEKSLIGMWSQVLGVHEISVHNSFVELGGDSISGTLFLNRVRDVYKIDLPFSMLFDETTSVAVLAGTIDKAVGCKTDAVK